jgi:transcriptional regulator with XRE-family HTH domain
MRSSSTCKASVSHQLREIIERSGKSLYDLETAAEIPRGTLSRFVAGKRSPNLATIDRLVEVLPIRLVEVERKVSKTRGKKS